MENQYNQIDPNVVITENNPNNPNNPNKTYISIGIAILAIIVLSAVAYFSLNSIQPASVAEVVKEDEQNVSPYYKIEEGRVYRMSGQSWIEIEGADPTTFEIIGDEPGLGFSQDKNFIYYGQMPIKNVDKETFTLIKDGMYLKDKNNVYTIMTEMKDALFVLEGADPKSFIVGDDISGYCAKDTKYEYFAGLNITLNPTSVNATTYKERCVWSENVSAVPTEVAVVDVPNDTIAECGNNWNCMIQASQTCSPAKATIRTEFDFFGSTVGAVTYMQIGKENNQCRSSQRVLESYTIIDGIRNEAPEGIVGMKGSCLFTMNNLTKMFTEWSKGNASTDDISNYGGTSCTGDLFGK